MAPGDTARPGRFPLGEAPVVPLEHTIEQVPGGKSVLFVSHFAEDRAGFVRRQTATAHGPIIRLVDEHVVGGFDGGDGTWSLVTSDGVRICLARFANASAEPSARGCVQQSPQAMARVGTRVLLLDAFVHRPPPDPPPPNPPRRKKKGKRSITLSAPRKPQPKLNVEVMGRWVTLLGEASGEPFSTGLRFTRPLEGMTLVDAAGRSDGVDVLWYQWKTPPKGVEPKGLGRASLVTGKLRIDGSWEPSTVQVLGEAELGYGYLEGWLQPRLVGDDTFTTFLALAGKGSQCAAVRLAPQTMLLAPGRAQCSVDVPGIIGGATPTAELAAALESIARASPRRAAGQPAIDAGQVSWAGDRGWFLSGTTAATGPSGATLRSAGRDGTMRDEAPAFAARRQRLAWSAIAADGEALAVIDARVQRVLPNGARGQALALPRALAGGIGERWLPSIDRGRAARIGSSWWSARGDVVRLLPEPLVVEPLRARAVADASVLVGGVEVGLFIEVLGARLRVSRLDPAGRLGVAMESAAAVRAGFDAVGRKQGGALLAGPGAGSGAGGGGRVATQVVGPDGLPRGASQATSLVLGEGELLVRMAALPGGGAWVADMGMRRVVWVDDDGREVGAASWPLETSAAECVDGAPARTHWPATEPGKMVRVPELAVPGTCVVGVPVWASDGMLRWVGARVSGIDSVAEVGIASVAGVGVGAVGTPAPSTTTTSSTSMSTSGGAAACPAEMVLAGTFCVDRFENTLVDQNDGALLPPDWPIAPGLIDFALAEWATGRARVGTLHARAWPLPHLPAWRWGTRPVPVAVPRFGARPNGYVSGNVATAACAAAGKRLCTPDEFLSACRGEADTQYPYGDTYQEGRCNVFREDHPAALLHDNASIGHLDPRLHRVTARGQPLYRETGRTSTCRSKWGDDAIYDMVGNVDEWVDEPGGAFAGGFFSRATKAGCDALITAHPKSYLDYSTGVRCCKNAVGVAAPVPATPAPAPDAPGSPPAPAAAVR